ncbi:MAG: thioredoxin domain-containing protein [Deltaproteobacteria bacterium]|nr:thioredoxin domain-containing protein [Deltaproteobacteria bacterium]
MASHEPAHSNRLIHESSPYLLQHAHNPVDWYPWGEEAFERARSLDRPIFLSVGYATCHWCHVMEHESFEDEAIAALLAREYVAVKVDREERPDVDATYMAAVMALRGQGGWPMTVVLTPEGQPFFAATYLPPRAGVRGVRMGLEELLEHLARDYREQREEIARAAGELTAHLVARAAPRPPEALPDAGALREAVARIALSYDAIHGGHGRAPKFPRPVTLDLLMRFHRRTGDPRLLEQVVHTLRAMADGGLNDQLGGGFHRYSVDERWRVPHFEKMLYDNGQLALTYLEAWQLTGEPRFREVVEHTLDYLLREMQAPEGAFYAATDADSLDPHGALEEGAFFTWTPAELEALLPAKDAALVARAFGVREGGDLDGRSVLHRPRPREALARELGLEPEALHRRLEPLRLKLLEARAGRPAPRRDEKILVAWNGLVLSALSRAGFALAREDYLEAGRRCARRLLDEARVEGELLHSLTGERRSGPAFLDDHALLAQGLLDLFEASGEPAWLEEAEAILGGLEAGFGDDEAGGYFQTGARHEALITREKPDYDGALPSGNSVAALLHLRLADLLQDPSHLARAEGILCGQASLLREAGPAVPLLGAALERRLDRVTEVVVVLPEGDPGEALLARLRRTYLPNRSLLVVAEERVEALARRLPLLAGRNALEGRATAYVCRGRTCELPTSDPEVLATLLAEPSPLP